MERSISSDFPQLQNNSGKKKWHYLDSAASALTPLSVINAINNYYQEYSCNIHRGVYDASVKLTDMYEEVRVKVQKFIGASAREEVFFTSGTTLGINILAQAINKKWLSQGDEICVFEAEHHANILPWLALEKEQGIKVKKVPLPKERRLHINDIERYCSQKTKVLALAHISNVLGCIQPIAAISAWARKKGILTVIDGAQAVPHCPVDMRELGCDFYVFSGHKLLGPTGVGVVYGRKENLDIIDPVIIGGEMIESVSFDKVIYKASPEKFEAGTPPIASVIGLGEAISYIQNIGWDFILKKEEGLRKKMQSELDGIDDIIDLSPQRDIPLFSLSLKNIHPHDVGTFLSEENIAVRVGQHCAEPLHQVLGIIASIRASLSFYNTEEDVEAFIQGILKIKDFFYGTK